MLRRDIINYDSAWEDVINAASGPDSPGRGEGRDLLTDQELVELCDVPVITVFTDGAPPVLPDETAPNPCRSAFLRAQAVEKGWALTDRFDWESMSRSPFSQVFFRFGSVGDPSAPLLRLGAGYGDEFNLTGPLRHRRQGDMRKTAAVIVISDSDFHNGVVGPSFAGDFRLLSQLHEMFHVVQLQESRPQDWLLARVNNERDAENAAVTAFQTYAGVSPVTAARIMLGRMATLFDSTAKYYFWPGLPVDDLIRGPFMVNGAVAYALHARAGAALPPYDLVQQWSLLQAGLMPRSVDEDPRPDLDRMTDVAVEQTADGKISAIFEGLSLLHEQKPPELPGFIAGFVGKCLQARQIVGALGARDVRTPARP